MEECDLRIRFATTKDGQACNDFHNRLYNDKRTLDQWQWDFVSNTYKHPQIPFVVVEDNGKIVGTQALIPIRMISKRGVFWTAKSEETLVDPDYRGRKLPEKMYDGLFKYAASNDLLCVWGFTAADKALRRVGFEIPARTSQLIFPFQCRRINALLTGAGGHEAPGLTGKLRISGYKIGCGAARLVSAIKFARSRRSTRSSAKLRSLELKTLDEAPEGAGEVCQRFIEQWGGTTIYRDTDYLRWRIFQNPYVKALMRAVYDGNQLLGWVIYSLDGEGIGYLVDVMVAVDREASYTASNVVRLLLTEAVIGVRNMGAIAMRGWHINHHPFDLMVTHAAKSMGFFPIRKGHSAVVYPIEKPNTSSTLDRFSNWYVTRIFMEGTVG